MQTGASGCFASSLGEPSKPLAPSFVSVDPDSLDRYAILWAYTKYAPVYLPPPPLAGVPFLQIYVLTLMKSAEFLTDMAYVESLEDANQSILREANLTQCELTKLKGRTC